MLAIEVRSRNTSSMEMGARAWEKYSSGLRKHLLRIAAILLVASDAPGCLGTAALRFEARHAGLDAELLGERLAG
jgi:hypothetical protein